jgi:hypothetical protein
MILDDESGAPDPSIAKLAELGAQPTGRDVGFAECRGLHGVVAKFEACARKFKPPSATALLAGQCAGAVAVLGLAFLVFGPSLWSSKPLTYAMTQGEIQAGGYFQSGLSSRSHDSILRRNPG